MDLTLSGTALDPNSISTVDSSSLDSSSVLSGNSSGSFDWGGLFTTISNDATAIIKATSSPQPVTVRPGTSYLNSQGQLITVPNQSNSKTLIFVGLGVILAFLLIRRLG